MCTCAESIAAGSIEHCFRDAYTYAMAGLTAEIPQKGEVAVGYRGSNVGCCIPKVYREHLRSSRSTEETWTEWQYRSAVAGCAFGEYNDDAVAVLLDIFLDIDQLSATRWLGFGMSEGTDDGLEEVDGFDEACVGVGGREDGVEYGG